MEGVCRRLTWRHGYLLTEIEQWPMSAVGVFGWGEDGSRGLMVTVPVEEGMMGERIV